MTARATWSRGLRASARPLALAGLAATALGAWLLFPREEGGRRLEPPVRAVLLDASASAARRTSGWNLWARRALREEALAARAAGEELLVVRFGADVEELQPPASPGVFLTRLRDSGLRLRLDPPADLASVLDAALALAEPTVTDPGRAPGRVRLLGDGSGTAPDPRPRVARLARAGVPLELVPPPAPDRADLALSDLRVPSAPAEGEPLAAVAALELRLGAGSLAELRAEALVELRVQLDAPGGLRAFERPVAWTAFAPAGEPGLLRAAVPIELGPAAPGRTLVTVRALLSGPGALRDGDPLPENDRASALTRAAGRRVVAAVADVADLPALRSWLGGPERFPGLQVLTCMPDGLTGLAGGLDLVVSFDLSHAALSEPVVSELVRAGGGWLYCGGWGLLRDWGARAGLADLLPVDLGREPGAERDVLLLVDGSGSMAGEPFELVKRALAELVVAALPGDSIELRFFTLVLGPSHRVDASTPAERRRSLASLMSQRAPRGQTAILDSLEELLRERGGRTRPMLVLLLSDGRDRNAFDLAERSAALRAGFGARSVELSAIAAGSDSNVELLRELVGPEGSLQIADDLRELAELFQREVHRERVREGADLRAEPARPEDLAGLPEAAEVVRAQRARPPESWPPLERYARARLMPGAEALWRGVEAEPLLAMQRVGAGRVAAWLSAPLPGWAPAWTGSADLLAPLLRALAGEGRAAGGPRLSVADGRLELSGAPASWPARVRARLYAPLLASAFEGSGLEEELGQLVLDPPAAGAGPDPRTRRAAPWPAWLDRVPAGATLRAELTGPGGGPVLAQLALTVPGPPELSPTRVRLRPVEVAAAGPRGAGPPSAPSPLGPPLLLAGLLALAAAALGDPFAPRRDVRGRAAGRGVKPLREAVEKR